VSSRSHLATVHSPGVNIFVSPLPSPTPPPLASPTTPPQILLGLGSKPHECIKVYFVCSLSYGIMMFFALALSIWHLSTGSYVPLHCFCGGEEGEEQGLVWEGAGAGGGVGPQRCCPFTR
jgi:hypothetical protein